MGCGGVELDCRAMFVLFQSIGLRPMLIMSQPFRLILLLPEGQQHS